MELLVVSVFSAQPPVGFEPVSLVDAKGCPVAEGVNKKHKSLWLVRVPYDVSVMKLNHSWWILWDLTLYQGHSAHFWRYMHEGRVNQEEEQGANAMGRSLGGSRGMLLWETC